MKKGVSFVLLRITVNKLVITASKTSGCISPISEISILSDSVFLY